MLLRRWIRIALIVACGCNGDPPFPADALPGTPGTTLPFDAGVGELDALLHHDASPDSPLLFLDAPDYAAPSQ